MPRRMTVMIGCPQHRRFVAGSYECDESGKPRIGESGQLTWVHTRCGQDGGRCMQTLCALHRYNRRGQGSWFPDRIVIPSPTPGSQG